MLLSLIFNNNINIFLERDNVYNFKIYVLYFPLKYRLIQNPLDKVSAVIGTNVSEESHQKMFQIFPNGGL